MSERERMELRVKLAELIRDLSANQSRAGSAWYEDRRAALWTIQDQLYGSDD